MPNNERGKIIWKIGELIDDHNEELAQLESLDNGKPVAVAGAADVPLSSDIFRYMAGWATKIEGNTIPYSLLIYTWRTISQLYSKRASRCLWSNYTMEFSFTYGCMETSSCTHCWVYYSIETS